MMLKIKNASAIRVMKAGAVIHKQVMQALVDTAAVGISTGELDEMAASMIKQAGAKASFKGYQGFPSSICTSVNEEIVHGIPSKQRVLKEGDLLKLDLGVFFEGFHVDAGRSVAIGQISTPAEALMKATRDAFFAGVAIIAPGVAINQIGKHIGQYAEARGYGVVRDLIGHGVGKELHEEPEVPNYFRPDLTEPLEAGMTLAIEPMLNLGTHRIRHHSDRWTISTHDGQLSAYYEDTVLVTNTGYEILT